MFRWFNRHCTADDADRQREEELERIERAAWNTPDPAQGQLLNRAGDLCARGGARRQAMEYYGRAVDAYLRAGYLDAAAALCRKLIRIAPDVVRAHCTLAFLSIGNEQHGDAQREIGVYVSAARATRTEKLAISRLHLMAEATDSEMVKRTIAEHLETLHDTLGSNRILTSLAAIEEGLQRPARAVDAAERWEHLLQAALTDPDELWKY